MLMTMLSAQNVRAQSCPLPFFCSRISSGTATKSGFAAFTDGGPGWDGVIHYYLRQDIFASDSIDFSLGDDAASGSLTADLMFSVNPTNGVGSWTNNSSVSESGQYGSLPFSITGAIYSVDIWPGSGWDWNDAIWQTTNNTDGTLTTNTGLLFAGENYGGNPDLTDFSGPLAGTRTTTTSDTVYSDNYVYNYSDGSDFVDDSYTITCTLSILYTDKLLAAVIDANTPAFTGNWTDPPTSLAASFSTTTNTDIYSEYYGDVSGSGTKMQYRVAVPASVKGHVYRFKWSETTQDSNGKAISKAKRTCAVIGTGDPVNPALGDIFTVQVPSQPGSIKAEGLAIEETSPSNPSPSPPAPPVSPAGAGGR